MERTMRLHYPVIITANDGAYSAVFPDFPDAGADADSVSEIMVAIDDALQEAVTIAVLKGEILPDPSPFEQTLTYDDDNATWWSMAHCDVPSDSENFDRIMSGLHEIEQEFMKKPVLVVGLETGVSSTEAETALGVTPREW
jgi:predicted RNase H-like HicB family nuclease